MIYPYSSIDNLRKSLRRKKTVFVSGCFDIIHPGHIEFLEKAATLGDTLIVGVLSDSYIRAKKKRQAVHTQQQRAKIVQALKPVTHVILTPYLKGPYPSLDVLRSLRPNVFFRQEKNHAYLPLKAEMKSLSISLKALSMPKVHSTSKTIRKVQKMPTLL